MESRHLNPPKTRRALLPTSQGPQSIPGSFLIALPCGALPAPHGPGRGTAGGAGEVARDAQLRLWSALHRGGGASPAARGRTPAAAPRLCRAAWGPAGDRGGVGGSPRLSAVLGARRGHALTCFWRWAVRGTQAAGWRGTAPRRPGPAVPAPSARAREAGAGAMSAATFCARRARSAGRIRSAGRTRAGRLRAAGARPEKAGGSGAARRPYPRCAPAPSGFSLPLLLSTPCARASPRSLNDAQVPPGAALFISLPSPERDSPSAASVSRPLASRQGVWGERSIGFGRRVSVTEFPITHSFGLFPEAGRLRLPPSSGRGRPLGKGRRRQVRRGSRRARCRLPRANEGHLYQSFVRLDSDFLLWQDAAIPPHLNFNEFRGNERGSSFSYASIKQFPSQRARQPGMRKDSPTTAEQLLEAQYQTLMYSTNF